MIDKFNRVGNIWINKLDSEVDSGNQICLMDYFNRAALASIVTVSSELLLSQKHTSSWHFCVVPSKVLTCNLSVPGVFALIVQMLALEIDLD